MSKRGNGEGSVYKRKSDGKWLAVFVLPDGRRKTLVAASRKEVDARLTAARESLRRGTYVTGRAQTVNTFLEAWLAGVKANLRPWTFKGYEVDVRLHLAPTIGRVQLDRLTPAHVQNLLDAKRDAGLSPKSVQKIRATLRSALNQALKLQMVSLNAAELATPPKVKRFKIQPLGLEEARTFFDAIRHDRLYALYAVAISLGLRQGEALGLRWRDVDQATGVIHVEYQLQRGYSGGLELVEPKTDRSRRTLSCPTEVAAILQEHAERQRFERRAAGVRWHESDHVFTTPIGTPLDGPNVTKSFQRLLAAAGLPRRRFHDLRHSCASLLLAQGVHPRVVMEVLGHSTITLTMNTYSHVPPELQRVAAAQHGAALFATAALEGTSVAAANNLLPPARC